MKTANMDGVESEHLTGQLTVVGVTASVLCAIHCTAMPLLLTLLPLAGLSFLASDWVEWALLGVSTLLGVSSLCLGLRKHGSRRAMAILAVGLAIIAAGCLADSAGLGRWEALLMLGGSLLMALAHVVNFLLCRACRFCDRDCC